MKTYAALLAAAMLGAGASAAAAQTPGGPPMNTYNSAYYVCSAGSDSFVVNYSGRNQAEARLQTNTNKSFKLHRSPVTSGYMYTGGGVQFWTDGSRVSLTGTAQPYKDCALKPS